MSERICLIVDDEPAIRGFLRVILKQHFPQFLEAENATDALRMIHEVGGRLDLLLSDINMPGDVNGLDLAHSVRRAFPAIPVILISGYFDKHSWKAAEFDFIAKPFVVGAILDATERALNSRSKGYALRESNTGTSLLSLGPNEPLPGPT